MSAPRQARHAFAAGQCLPDTLLRSFVGYGEWLAPWWYAEALHAKDVKKVLFDGRHVVAPGELWLFTDSAIASVSATVGSGLGVFAAGLHGADIFGELKDVERVRINPNCGPGEELVFDGELLPTLRRWAAAVTFERDVADGGFAGALEFEFLVPRFPDQRFVTKQGEGGFAHPAVVCSAPDARNAFIESLPELAQQVRWEKMDGRALLAASADHSLDALFLNPFGPSAQLIARERLQKSPEGA